jgi:hypothetical protein
MHTVIWTLFLRSLMDELRTSRSYRMPYAWIGVADVEHNLLSELDQRQPPQETDVGAVIDVHASIKAPGYQRPAPEYREAPRSARPKQRGMVLTTPHRRSPVNCSRGEHKCI